MAFQHLDIRVRRHGPEQGAFDLLARRVARMEHPPPRVSALLPEVERGTPGRSLAFIELDAHFDQLLDPRRSLANDRPHRRLVAKAVTGFERVLDVQLERIIVAGHASDAALGIIGVRFGADVLCDDRHGAVNRRFDRETESRDAAADDDEIVGFHKRMLSMSRVRPKNAASATSVLPGWICDRGCRLSASTIST